MAQTVNKAYMGTRQKVGIEWEMPILLPPVQAVTGNQIQLVDEDGGEGGLYAMGIEENDLYGQTIYILQHGASVSGNASSTWAGCTLRVVANTSLLGGSDIITVQEVIEGTDKWNDLPAAAFEVYSAGTPPANPATWGERMAVSMRGLHPGKGNMHSMRMDVRGVCIPDTDFITNTTFRGEKAQVTEMFGVIDQASLGDPKHDLAELFAHGSTNMPKRHVLVHNRTTYENSWPLSAVIAKRMAGAFGHVNEKASLYDTTDDIILVDIYPGDYLIVMDGDVTASVAEDDYVQVGNQSAADPSTATDGEIRKVTSVQYQSTNGYSVIFVDKPFRRNHRIDATTPANGDRCTKVHANCLLYTSTENITHEMVVGHNIWYHTVAVNKKHELDDSDKEDFYLTYHGLMFPEISFKSSTNEEMKVDMSSRGLYAQKDFDTKDEDNLSIDPPDLATTLFYISGVALKPVHFTRSRVLFDSVEWPQNEDMEMTVTREVETRWAHGGITGSGALGGAEPWAHYPGRVTQRANFNVPLHNKQLWDILKTRSAIDVQVVFEIIRSTTFTETWTFDVSEMYLEDASLELPTAGSESQNIMGPPKDVKLTVVDKIPYY